MATEPAPPGRPPVIPTEHVRVLLVDDDESTAVLVRSHLGKLKPTRYALEWRGTAGDGLAALLGERWDACLLDYHIGDESGFDVLRTALQRNVSTPIIMFTSGAGADVDLATVRAGAADYLLKTELSPSLLSRTIRYAIERSRLLNEMRSLARHDHLTGLLTRREMDRVLDEELVRSHRYGHPVALVLIDIDHFKQVNDTYGHVAGDAALRAVAAVVSQCARDTDRAARYGGDELAVLLPETDHVGACVLAERIRSKVVSAGVEPPPDAQVSVTSIALTLSIGVAALPGSTASTPSEFIARADAALYQAKRGGRNQVVCAD
ncbi:MAG: diguanylate cyclase [Vicinamibacteraceae bacterium]